MRQVFKRKNLEKELVWGGAPSLIAFNEASPLQNFLVIM